MSIIKGQNLRVLVDSKCIAMAKSATFHLSASLEDISTKDDTGDWAEQEVTGLSWDCSTESLVTLTDNGVNGELTTALMNLIINKTKVQLVFDTTSGTNNRVAQNSAIKKSGYAYLSDFSINSQNRTAVSCSCQFTGTGAIS